MRVRVSLRMVRDAEYGRFGVDRAVREAGGELVAADDPPSEAWSPRPGLYCTGSHHWRLTVEIPRRRIPELSPALAGAFVDLDRRSVLAVLEVWTIDGEERLWPTSNRPPWQRDPKAWKDDHDGPGSDPAGGGLFAEGGFWW